MADKDQYNDEYQFADLDSITPDSGVEGDPTTVDAAPEQSLHSTYSEPSDIKKNSFIVIGIIILAMLVYKIVSWYFAEKKNTPPPVAMVVPKPVPTPTPAPAKPTPAPVPIVPPPQANAPSVDDQINKKLATLELGQQGMRSDISTVNSQVDGINTNLNALLTKITQLNDVISNLSAKVDAQSQEIERLTMKREVKKARYVPHRAAHFSKYYIQAVIPGRAWLIATNGSTLTVREGSVVPGYGMVKLIDPTQGRVTTSSGQVIRFSQEDS